MITIPTRQDVAAQLRALIAGTKTREEVSLWACPYVLDDNLEIPDRVVFDALESLLGADVHGEPGKYLYHEVDFRHWLEELLRKGPADGE